MQYVIKKRIDRARYLIITTDKKISTIASECGFNDMSYFAKQFKRIVGISPKEYKKGAVKKLKSSLAALFLCKNKARS